MTEKMNTDFKVSEVKLAYRHKVPYRERKRVNDSVVAYCILKETYPDEQIDHKEIFKALYLNRANHAVGCLTISEGGISGAVADIRLIFQGAVLLNATSLILAHNHPKGGISPSKDDIMTTGRLFNLFATVGVRLCAHYIVADGAVGRIESDMVYDPSYKG